MKKIIICGAGLAGSMCAATLEKILPQNIQLTLIDTSTASYTDLFFGTEAPPTSYEFLLNIGITEPDLLPASQTAFSLGTRYVNWGPEKRSWTQAFHKPLPVFNGVGFHHYLNRIGKSSPELGHLENYIMSVHATNKGVFAHPPQNDKPPLADMEYGYQFLPKQWTSFILKKVNSTRIKMIKSDVHRVERTGDKVTSISLTNGQVIEVDFLINCDSSIAKHIVDEGNDWIGYRHLSAIETYEAKDVLGNVCRVLTGTDYGWQSDTALQDGHHRLTVYDPKFKFQANEIDEPSNNSAVNITTGRLTAPWTGNCLSLGHAAAALEPMTSAPLMLLQKDIKRLTELIPTSTDMTIERREYNRRFTHDYRLTKLFHAVFFKTVETPQSNYWQAAKNDFKDEALETKISQFLSRGVIVEFDHEPFGKQDWLTLLYGLGFKPRRYDPLADRMPDAQIKQTLENMQSAMKAMAERMPPHNVYMSNLLRYLKKQNDQPSTE